MIIKRKPSPYVIWTEMCQWNLLRMYESWQVMEEFLLMIICNILLRQFPYFHSVIHADSYGALKLYSISHIIILGSLIIWDPALWIWRCLQIGRYCACVEAEYHFQFALQLRREHLAIKNNIILKNCFSMHSHRKIIFAEPDVFKNSRFEGFYQQVLPLWHNIYVRQNIKKYLTV